MSIGIADFAKEASTKNLGVPKVHLSFQLDSSGITSLVKAEATVELPEEPEPEPVVAEDNATETVAAADGTATEGTDAEAGKEVGNNNTATGDADDAKKTTDADASKDGKKDSKKDTKDGKKGKDSKKDTKKKEKKDNTLRRALGTAENTNLVTPNAWTPAAIAESKARLRALNAADDARKAKEAALNDLEGYIYKVRILEAGSF